MKSEKKLLLLSDLNSVHTQRWARAMAEAGFEVHIIGFHNIEIKSFYLEHNKIKTYSLGLAKNGSKFLYFKSIPELLKLKWQINPDLLHAHFASSYGFLGAIVKGVTPYFITLWGGDVLIFPKQGFVKKLILRFNLSRADKIFAASNALKIASEDIYSKTVTIIPFGVESKKYKSPRESEDRSYLTIGTIKGLEAVYGIDVLIKSFAIVSKRNKSIALKLLIAGSGSHEKLLKDLCLTEGVSQDVKFLGKVKHEKVPDLLQEIDIFVALSRSESFGVAILEAQAAGKPVVVTNVGGLPEVVEDNVTGLIVPSEDIEAAANAIESLVKSSDLRLRLGSAGVERVKSLFEWNQNVSSMISEYKDHIR